MISSLKRAHGPALLIRSLALTTLAITGSDALLAASRARPIESPNQGVLCDQQAQRCYDEMGLSLGLTRTYYGVMAEQRAMAELGGRRPPRRFNLSNGVFCDVDVRTCWRDGRNRNQIAERLTRDLFGSLPGPVPKPTPTPTPTPSPTPAANLTYPMPGVICDTFFKICYDRQGVSQVISASTYGAVGMRNATAAIQQGLQRQFVLSNGTLCDVRTPGCWSDGAARRIPASGINAQLFGTSPSGGGSGTATGSCRLQRGFQLLYNGGCQLIQQQDGNRLRFIAQLGNGASYTFIARDGSYRISDGSGGSWPVSHTDRGRSAQFRWADMSLDVTQNSYIGTPGLGRTLGNLLEGLFN